MPCLSDSVSLSSDDGLSLFKFPHDLYLALALKTYLDVHPLLACALLHEDERTSLKAAEQTRRSAAAPAARRDRYRPAHR